MSDDQQQQPTDSSQGPATQNPTSAAVPTGKAAADKKMLIGILGIVLGGFGIHKFLLGYQKEGIIMLVVSVATCGFGYSVMGIIGLVEGIMYLTKSDEEFANTYLANKKAWF